MAYFKVEVVETFKYTVLIEADNKQDAIYATDDIECSKRGCWEYQEFKVTELVEKHDDSDIDFDEDRVDVVGQNGNNGEHYE